MYVVYVILVEILIPAAVILLCVLFKNKLILRSRMRRTRLFFRYIYNFSFRNNWCGRLRKTARRREKKEKTQPRTYGKLTEMRLSERFSSSRCGTHMEMHDNLKTSCAHRNAARRVLLKCVWFMLSLMLFIRPVN